jgi:hypothetical protein
MKHLTFFLAFCLPLFLSAQKNFQKGYIVSLAGDTTMGFIDYKEWDSSPESILFTSSPFSDSTNRYNVNHLHSFEILNKEAYRRFIVKLSLDPVKLEEINVKDTSSRIDTVFLKVIQTGRVLSLFSYSDRIKTRFFILQNGEEPPVELGFKEYYQDDDLTKLITEDLYKGQLRNILYSNNSFTDKLSRKITDARYQEAALKEIAFLMNGTTVQEQEKLKENQSPSIRFFAGIGLQRNKITFDGQHYFASNTSRSNSTFLPKVSAGIDLFAKPNVRRLVFRTELGFQMNKSTSAGKKSFDGFQREYEISGMTVSLFPQIIYNLYNADKFKFHLGIGMGYHYVNYSSNTYRQTNVNTGVVSLEKEDYFELKKGYPAPMARAGITLFNNIETSFIYYFPATITRYLGFDIRTGSMLFQVNYLFDRRKK